jgi:hypothetical protein
VVDWDPALRAVGCGGAVDAVCASERVPSPSALWAPTTNECSTPPVSAPTVQAELPAGTDQTRVSSTKSSVPLEK